MLGSVLQILFIKSICLDEINKYSNTFLVTTAEMPRPVRSLLFQRTILFFRLDIVCMFLYGDCDCRDTLREVIQLIRNTSNPQVEFLTRVMKKWAKDNKLQI